MYKNKYHEITTPEGETEISLILCIHCHSVVDLTLKNKKERNSMHVQVRTKISQKMPSENKEMNLTVISTFKNI